MREREDIVVAVIAAAPEGKLTSRVRLQKTVYLLDRLQFESGFTFDYHHFGPYSRALDNATSDAKAFSLISEKTEHRLSDGASYSVFEINDTVIPKAGVYGKLGEKSARDLVDRFARTNVTVLELAATVDWLWRFEHVTDWNAEVKKRKRAKVGGGKLESAIDLLRGLGLDPPRVRSKVA
jgi:uncharacterized protein YwgA